MLSGQQKIFFRSVLIGLCVVSNLAFAIKIEPGVGVGVEYTDNAKLTADNDSGNRVSDAIAIGYVGLNFVEKEGNIQYDVNAALSKQIYLDDSFADQQYFNLGASANWEVLRNRFNWFVRDRFNQRPIQELTSNTPDNLQDSNIFTFGANLNWPISSVQNFTLTPQLSQHYFEKQSTDNQQLSLAASWNYQAFRLTSMGLNLGARAVDYTEENSSGQSRSDTDFLNASILFNTRFRRSNLVFDIGTTSVKQSDGSNNSGFSGSGFTGKVEWIGDLTSSSNLRTSFSTELTDASSVAFSADNPENSSVDNLEVTADVVRNSLFHLTYIRDDASLNSRYWIESRKVRYSGTLLTRETQAVGLTLNRPITRLLSSSAYLKFNRTKQLETLRKDKRYTAGASLKYLMSRKMNALFDVKFRKKNSNSVDDKYDEFSVFIRLVYGFGDVTRPTRSGGF